MSDDKIVPITDRAAHDNKAVRGECDSMTGFVKEVTTLSHLSAVAFSLEAAEKEKLFWIKTDKEDADYRLPLQGQRMTVWFNDKARNLDVFGEPAQGVVEVENISNASEESHFAWFRKQGNKPLPWE